MLGASVALVLFTGVSAAQTALRLARVVQRATGPKDQATTNSAKTLRIAGTVVDAGGKPTAGAMVECYQYDRDEAPFARRDLKPKQRLTTGADGAFEFRASPETILVLARKVGLAPAWAYHWNFTRDITDERLVFGPPTTLAGVVVDERDKPVAGAQVWVSTAYAEKPTEEEGMAYAYIAGRPARDCFSTRTGADGKFMFQAFPNNTAADLAVSKPGKVLREPQREYTSPDTMRCRSGDQDIKLVVEPAAAIEGKVVIQETGQPLAGMRLEAQAARAPYFSGGQHEAVVSGADGTFRLPDLAPGTYRLRATFGTNYPSEWVAETVSATVDAGHTNSEVKVSAVRGGFLEVAVLGKDDRKPVATAGVNAYREAYWATGKSGDNGLALLRLPPGEYQVSASRENSRSEASTLTVETGRTNQVQIELSPLPKITGIVREPSGAVVPDLELSIFPNWGLNGGGAKTDAKGHYEMSWNAQRLGPSGGGSCLIARDVGRNLAAARDIDEDTSALDIQLQPGLVAAGRVEDVNGKPLSNAAVRVYLWSGNAGYPFMEKPARTDGRGRFELTTMPPGRRYSLHADAKGYGSASRSIEEEAETNRMEVEPFVLKIADHKLAGEVVDSDEKPVARATVSIHGEGQPNGTARTDNSGRFKFDAVCEGTVYLSTSARSAHGNTRAEAGATNVVIRLGESRSYSSRQAPKRASLRGKPLPDLAAVELSSEAVPAGKPLLLCLFDIEQRPSRRFVKQLAEQHDALRLKGLTVLGVQASVTTADALKEWKDANSVPFPVGRVAAKADKTKWASEVDSLPWLILTDGEGRVTAEGFALDELDAKLKGQARR
jgi:protocatechuate 3,4-dioxygenase beta subunit